MSVKNAQRKIKGTRGQNKPSLEEQILQRDQVIREQAKRIKHLEDELFEITVLIPPVPGDEITRE